MLIDLNNPPPILRKKVLVIMAWIIGVLLLVGIALSVMNYMNHPHWRMKRILDPMLLPALPAMIYACVLLFWVLLKVVAFKNQVISRAPEVFSAPNLALQPGESILFEHASSILVPPGGGFQKKVGSLFITNTRIAHVTRISVKRVQLLVGMQEPDLSESFSISEIQHCGFGLNENNPKYFAFITKRGQLFSTTTLYQFEMEEAFSDKRWSRMEMNGLVSWRTNG